MLDQASGAQAEAEFQAADSYDLIVVGAGICGLNALFAAAEYLPKTAKVLLIDEKDVAGGMWNTAYDYVRLHQPHPMFTVGDMKWDWRKPRSYLARRDEVRGHLARATGAVAGKVVLSTVFGHRVSHCDEVKTPGGYMARVTLHPNDAPGQSRTLWAKRAIFAPGVNYHQAEPLALSSDQVISIIPQDLQETLAAHPGAEVYVIGGGKTAMDTILAALAQDPQRRVTLVKGQGTNFLNRTRYVPTGLRRWTSGELVSRLFRDLALHFDGTNGGETIAHFRRNHSTDPDGQNGHFLYGLQSEDEHDRIAQGLSQTVGAYLQDVTGTPDGPVMTLRGGGTLPVPPGSIFVNCCGSFFRSAQMEAPAEFLSPQAAVLTISVRSSIHFLTSVAAFFATHLLYRDGLRGNGLYTLDHEALFRKDRNAWLGASAAQAYMNQVIAVQTLPMTLLDRCGLDMDRWYPLPRRLAGLIKMKATAARDIAHCRQALDTVASRHGIACAPLA